MTSAEWPRPSAAHGTREYRGTLITRAGNTTFQHDAQGRTVLRRRRTLSGQVREWRYEWSAEDRLVGVVTPDGVRWRYGYDPLGRRVTKQRLAGDTVVEQVDFTWDGTVLAEQTTGSRTTTWDWAPSEFRPVTQVELDQSEVDARFHALVTDLVGTPTEMVGPGGELVWHRRASLWGNAGVGERCPLRFPGQYHDPESGFDYNLFRHYDPETARYGSTDPLELGGGPNPHAYVTNPTRLFDPLGLAPCAPPQKTTALPEEKRSSPLKPQQAMDEWEKFLGDGPYTNKHPITGKEDPDRLVSADGQRSIRMGGHEMGSKPTKFHYHEETWDFISPTNEWVVGNTMVRVPLGLK